METGEVQFWSITVIVAALFFTGAIFNLRACDVRDREIRFGAYQECLEKSNDPRDCQPIANPGR
jgi:hypothetical protein